jgi:hypothetical protein
MSYIEISTIVFRLNRERNLKLFPTSAHLVTCLVLVNSKGRSVGAGWGKFQNSPEMIMAQSCSDAQKWGCHVGGGYGDLRVRWGIGPPRNKLQLSNLVLPVPLTSCCRTKLHHYQVVVPNTSCQLYHTHPHGTITTNLVLLLSSYFCYTCYVYLTVLIHNSTLQNGALHNGTFLKDTVHNSTLKKYITKWYSVTERYSYKMVHGRKSSTCYLKQYVTKRYSYKMVHYKTVHRHNVMLHYSSLQLHQPWIGRALKGQ